MVWAKLKKQIWQWRGVWVTAPVVGGVFLVVRLTGWLQPLEWMALDLFFRWRPPEQRDERIVIVGIEESDLQKYGWPISDDKLAELIDKVKTQKPVAMGLDLYRDMPVKSGYEKLMKVFNSTPNLIGIEKKIGDKDSSAVAAAPVLKKLGQVGVNDVVVDDDGKLRRGLLFLDTPEGESLPSLGLMLAMIYLQEKNVFPDPNSVNLKFNNAEFVPFESNDGAYIKADAGGYQVLLNYRGPARTFFHVSMQDVMENRLSQDFFQNKVVFIGPTATSLKDYFYTPFSQPQQTAGVEVQATLTSQIISAALQNRPLLKVWDDWLESVWIYLWCGVGCLVSWAAGSRRWTVLVIGVANVNLIGICYLSFLGGLWLPVVPPVLCLLSCFMIINAYFAHVERQDRQTVMNLFGRHVTPKIAEVIWRERDQILKEGRLSGRKVTATVLFTDIKNFSTIAENLEPEKLMCWLNEYMEEMAGLVLEKGGVVDKFIGDSVMAVFGVPFARTTPEGVASDAKAAVSCALEMASKLRLLNQHWERQGQPTIAMRVGICTGSVVIGSLGSREREDYTVIGDSVNVAARLESFDKSIDGGICRILISEETYFHVKGEFATRYLGSELLKGRKQPVNIYHVML